MAGQKSNLVLAWAVSGSFKPTPLRGVLAFDGRGPEDVRVFRRLGLELAPCLPCSLLRDLCSSL